MSDESVPQYLLDLAQQNPAPAALTVAGLRRRFVDATTLEVSAGQVWRARWDDTSVLLVITGHEDRSTITAAPVTIDPTAEDDRCLVVEPDATVFGADVTVWAGLTAHMPIRVLEQPVDVWDSDLVCGITELCRAAEAHAPVRTRRGAAIESPFEPAAMLRAELQDDLDALRNSPALPVGDSEHPPRSLQSQLGPKMDFPALVKQLAAFGLTQADVMRVLNGKAPLTPEVARAVADVTGLRQEQVAESVQTLPPDFVAEVDQPAWRPRWQKRAAREGTDEATARLRESYDLFARAARQTGGGAADWRERLRQYLLSSTAREQDDR